MPKPTLSCKWLGLPMWLELTLSTPEIYYPWVQTKEGKAGDGIKGLLKVVKYMHVQTRKF